MEARGSDPATFGGVAQGGNLRVSVAVGGVLPKGRALSAATLMPPPRLRPAFVGHDDAGVPTKQSASQGGFVRRSEGCGLARDISGHERSHRESRR